MKQSELERLLISCIIKCDIIINNLQEQFNPNVHMIKAQAETRREAFKAVFQAINGNQALIEMFAKSI